jgi:hypothetical protein
MERDGNGYPDCDECWGNGVVAQTTLGRPYPDARTKPCPKCGGSGRGEYDLMLTDDVRLGAVVTGLTLASKTIRQAVEQASPRTRLRQPLDGEEHRGHWLTRKQVYDAAHAAAEVERILRELSQRVSVLSRPAPSRESQQDTGRALIPETPS